MKITLYTSAFCPFCIRAKSLLDGRKLDYTEHVMDSRQDELAKVKAKYGHPTVPLVLVDGKLIGGCTELEALMASGKLA
ncbi:MAG: glutaredoxin [Planctomycetes bacterium]|nr:glutaredoxin [Planctomycetota bacterium]